MKPRNFVAKHAHAAGRAGPMENSKRATQVLREQKHKGGNTMTPNQFEDSDIPEDDAPAEGSTFPADRLPLLTQFRRNAGLRQAYVINPDGSIGFTAEAWDGR